MHVLVSKYADHLPLYRQAQIYSRQGIDLDRSTLAAWVGKSAFELTPVYEALMTDLERSTKLFMDETPAPVLAPGCSGQHADTILKGFSGILQVPSRQIALQSPAGQWMDMLAIGACSNVQHKT
jgi:transposase